MLSIFDDRNKFHTKSAIHDDVGKVWALVQNVTFAPRTFVHSQHGYSNAALALIKGTD